MSRLCVIFSVFLVALTSCDKGYRIRFSNYYVEPMDSVQIGQPGAKFTNIERNTNSGYQPITSGKHHVYCRTKSGAVLWSSAPLAKDGSGDYTVQVDAIGNFSLLKD